MTVTCIIGLLLQAAAVWLVHVVNRGVWLRRPAALLLAVAVAEHGVTELMQAAWPGRDRYRTLIGAGALDRWMLLVSAMILLYAVAYSAVVLVVRRRYPVAERHPDDAAPVIAGLDPRLLLVLVAPLAVATLVGRGAVAR